MNFKTFRNKETGIEAQYPAHYETHPVYKNLLEPVDTDSDTNDEVEVDKVVVDDSHELPVEQRTAKRTRKKAAADAEATDTEPIDVVDATTEDKE